MFILTIMTRPDFIIIGAMKSATSTLHAQLALQPGIFMTTPKEPNYFSDDIQYARGDQWYDALFAEAGANDICGESSTHYTKLPDYPFAVERMAKRLRRPKLIYVLRHPIDRLISHYIHQWTQNIIKCDIDRAIGEYQELTAYSCYATQLEPYLNQFGREAILLVFSERLKQDPQNQLERIARFIGHREEVRWQSQAALQNASQARIRPFSGYSWLVESELMTYLRRKWVPKTIRNKIKRKFTMQERPVITEARINQLTEIFDRDLGRLGKWLDVTLNCSNYYEVAQCRELKWNNNILSKSCDIEY